MATFGWLFTLRKHMSKAIEGAALLAGALVLSAVVLPAGSALIPYALGMELSLASGGLSMEMGAIADALTANRGMNITTRQAARYRQVIYGIQRVGGVIVYRSTTGSTHNQFNYVIVLAGHECWAIENLYLDGRQVFFDTNSGGNSTRNGYNFGGSANGNQYTGPGGQQYNFGGLVYCEARYGDQLPGDVITGLTANDPQWATSASGSPFVGGCTYVYLKVEYNTGTFPGEPEIRFTVHGRPVYDPRTNTTAYSSNWALIQNAALTDPDFGIGDASVNQDQLIAAANVCDEQIALAAGGTESQYSCHWHYDTSTAPGDVLSTTSNAAAGRLSRIGGELFIWPAYYQGPSASFGADALTAAPVWSETRSFRELFNRVTGTYIAPNYPYNVSGNLYDANGWYNGTIQNNFPFAFQPTNYPEYASDALHGYPADEWLNEDGGIVLPKEINQQCVLSVVQAQRLAKIFLLRNRLQGTGVLQMSLAAHTLQPCDTFLMTFPQQGWQDKLLEVNSVKFIMDSGGQGQAPKLTLEVGVNETEATAYEWSIIEELTVYDVPAAPSQVPYVVAPPTNVTIISSAATAIQNPDGSVTPRIEAEWDTPLDAYVTQIQMQYQLVGASAWIDAGMVDVSLNAGFIAGIVSGQLYNVRIRSVRASGASSVWVEIDALPTGLVIASQTQDGVGRGTLLGEAYADGTAGIVCNAFTAAIGQLSLPIFPGGAVTLRGLAQQTLYYVYYNDPTSVGGNLTPVATTNKADFLGKLGYWLIDSIVTPVYTSGVSGMRYVPSTFSDVGSRTSSYPSSAYDNNLSTSAGVSGGASSEYFFGGGGGQVYSYSAYGRCTWSGFASFAATVDMTLTAVFNTTTSASGGASAGTASIWAMVGTTLLTPTVTSTGQTWNIPSGTDLSTVTVTAMAQPGACPDATETNTDVETSAQISMVEIYIQQ
jgi:hypothetical protein